MTPDTFLRACLRRRIVPGSHEELRAAAHDVEGGLPALLQVIHSERVGPLLHRTIGDLDVLPPKINEVLQRSYRLNAVLNMLRFAELARCLQALAAHGVPVIVLKGAALAEGVYRGMALRPMCDVDLLVHRHDMTPVRGVLEQLGYSLHRAETHPGVLAEHENEIAFRKPGQVESVMDVHWSLVDSPYYQQRMSMDWFWATAQPAVIAQAEVLVLGPEALVLHLCSHLALHHGAAGLLWWHDIAEVIALYGTRIDWQTMLAKAREYEMILALRTVLSPLAADWAAPIPASVLQELTAAPPSRQEERVFAQLSTAERPAGQRFLEDLGSMSSWRQRLHFARTNLFPSAAYMRQRYRIRSPWLLPVYYPYRWLRGLFGWR